MIRAAVWRSWSRRASRWPIAIPVLGADPAVRRVRVRSADRPLIGRRRRRPQHRRRPRRRSDARHSEQVGAGRAPSEAPESAQAATSRPNADKADKADKDAGGDRHGHGHRQAGRRWPGPSELLVDGRVEDLGSLGRAAVVLGRQEPAQAPTSASRSRSSGSSEAGGTELDVEHGERDGDPRARQAAVGRWAMGGRADAPRMEALDGQRQARQGRRWSTGSEQGQRRPAARSLGSIRGAGPCVRIGRMELTWYGRTCVRFRGRDAVVVDRSVSSRSWGRRVAGSPATS